MTIDRTNAVCGIFLILSGLLFAQQSLSVELGTWLKIGPGGLPLVLSGILILLGIVLLVQALNTPSEEVVGRLPWRGMFFILLAPIIFGLIARPLGFVPATFICSLFASFASVRMRPLWALALAAVLTVFSTIVFSYGLGLPFERFGPWLRF